MSGYDFSIDKEFWEVVRKALKESGLSQNRFSKKCGVSNAVISLWVNEKRRPSLSCAIRVANNIGYDLGKLQRKFNAK